MSSRSLEATTGTMSGAVSDIVRGSRTDLMHLAALPGVAINSPSD